MYKITLFDYNCPSCTSGTAEFFTNDIEDFQKRWFKLETDKGRKQRLLDSKNGHIVVDYYSNGPELNIVQKENSHLYEERLFKMHNKDFIIHNSYGCEGKYYADLIRLNFQWIKFKEDFYRIANYNIQGICQKSLLYDNYGWEEVICYGNPIIENSIKVEKIGKEKGTKEQFKENNLQSICYLPSKKFRSEAQLKEDIHSFEITDRIIDELFRDIIGEAG